MAGVYTYFQEISRLLEDDERQYEVANNMTILEMTLRFASSYSSIDIQVDPYWSEMWVFLVQINH